MRVLLIEDDSDIRNSLVQDLANQGFEVVALRNGREALDYLSSGAPRPEAIVLDLMLPIMSGYQFRAVQLSMPEIAHIPAVVITADHRASEKAADLHLSVILRKPFSLPQLVDALNATCGDGTNSPRA